MDTLYPLFRIAELIAKEKSEDLSASESEILQTWLAQNEKNKATYARLQNEENILTALEALKKFDSDKAFAKIEKQLTPIDSRFRLPVYLKYAAAIALIISLSYVIISKLHKPGLHQNTQFTILPGKQKAILITGNNQKIELDSSSREQFIQDESVNIVNNGSTLSYNENATPGKTNTVSNFNTLITPRGGEYTVILSDGTVVMLNSESRLTYPIVFNINMREVTLEGEAFFKVKKSDKIPFVVKANSVNVIVYGTVFNVSAYKAESFVQTTLLEGSVGINLESNRSAPETKIKPRQQLTFNKGSGYMETKEVNPEQFIAWTKGTFAFENEPIENIMRVIARWYDFDFIIENNEIKKQRFTLSIGRYNEASKILNMMSASSNITFSTKDNIVTITSK